MLLRNYAMFCDLKSVQSGYPNGGAYSAPPYPMAGGGVYPVVANIITFPPDHLFRASCGPDLLKKSLLAQLSLQ